MGNKGESSYESSMIFNNTNLGGAVASISQTSVRSGVMNQTGGNFGNFSVQLANNSAARNSVVGNRHIPITKFTRGATRGRGGQDGDNGKRVSSINFYTNSHGSKLKNALDLSINNTAAYESTAGSALNQSLMLNESMVSGQHHQMSKTTGKGSSPSAGPH